MFKCMSWYHGTSSNLEILGFFSYFSCPASLNIWTKLLPQTLRSGCPSGAIVAEKCWLIPQTCCCIIIEPDWREESNNIS